MTFNAPDLSEVLDNEQTLNTNLTSFRNELRDSLDTLGIEYQSSDTILDLIRLLDWKQSKAIDIDSTFDNEKVLDLISNRIAMVGPATIYNPDYGEGWSLYQLSAAPDYRFIPYTLASFGDGKSSGDATGVWVFTNEETSYTLSNDWTYECLIYPRSGISGTNVYRGLAILIGNDWQDFSTYQGWCAGLSLNNTTYSSFIGKWISTNEATMTALGGTIYAGSTYHIKMRHIAAAHGIFLTISEYDDGEDGETISRATLSVRDITSNFSQEVRFGMFSKFYAYESPLYGPGYSLSNVKVK